MLYPKMSESRMLTELGGVWDFCTAGAEDYPAELVEKPLENPMAMAVPASYNDQRDDVNLRAHYGWVVYQRRFTLPRAFSGQRAVLRFGAVTHKAEVYLNGKLVGKHTGGFLPFEFEINGCLKDGENLLAVAADNKVNSSTLPVGNEGGVAFFGSDNYGIPSVELAKTRRKPQNYPNFDFFNYAGINRPVYIYTTPASYIRDITIVPAVDGADGIVTYKADTEGEGNVKIEILDETKKVIASGEGAEGRITVPGARLWKPGNAYLYTARVTFGEDVYEQAFGIRTVEVRGTEFLINGEPFYFKGFGKHEDSYFHGRGLDQCLNVKDISVMRWMGANSFRTSHYPYAEEMYDLCDREGIVIIDEVPAVGISTGWEVNPYERLKIHQHHRDVISDMIDRDKNHPCVVMWSLANEPDTEHFPQEAYDYFMPLYELAHRLDPQNRPVTLVSCQNNYERDIITPAMDVCCINRYYGWYNLSGDLNAACDALNTELDFWEKLGKPVMLTEYGADTVAGVHNTNGEMFSEEFQAEYFKRIDEELDKRPFIVGEQVWNFADFSTIQGTMRADGNRKGVLTRERRPKLAAHYLRNRWNLKK
ncbi:MAG: beta-glucuronidase [Ruminococcus sp.]|nr:beta-glucuronidase [Ruminococcus sp.]MCM1381189.1 beta-glucuronidase [Muribaculaceae bacterium]